MASSTASWLLSFTKHNSALQSLVRSQLLRPTAATTPSIIHPPSRTAERQTPDLKPAQKSTNITEISEKMMKNPVADIRGFYPSGMVGFPGVDQPGIMQARKDSDGSFGFVSETDLEDSDGDFGFDLNHYDDADEDDDDDLFQDTHDEDGSDSE